MSDLKEIFNIKGMAAEYHVNRMLNRYLGAARFRGQPGDSPCAFLFDGLVLPYGKQDLTEIDHVLVSKKGVFAIETKSIAGKVFGERQSDDWYSVNPSPYESEGLIDRRFTNPFKQNMKHIKAVQEIMGSLPIADSKWVENYVVFVNADDEGWVDGRWAGKPINGLFLSGMSLVEHIKSMPNKLSCESVKLIASSLNAYYLKKSVLRKKFDERFSDKV